MRFVLTAVIFVIGLGFLAAGIGFLVQPEASAATFGLAAQGTQGLAVLRADMNAFFSVAGIAMLYGAWKRDGDALLVAALLVGIAFLGRVVSIFADGTYDNFWLPMLGEAVVAILCLVGGEVLPHHFAEAEEE